MDNASPPAPDLSDPAALGGTGTGGDAHPNDASCLTLLTRAASPKAERLVAALVNAVEAEERRRGRTYKRGPKVRADLALAVVALAGGLLLNAPRHGRREWSWQTTGHDTFKGEAVTKRHFQTARDMLIRCGLVEKHGAFTRFYNFGAGNAGKQRKAARFRATEALFALAGEHGLALPDMGRHWRRERPRVDPEPLAVSELSERIEGRRIPGAELPVPDTDEARALADGVRAMNSFVRGMHVEGCDPPLFFRGFTHNLDHGGRWYAVGGGYQQMKGGGARRVAELRIADEPVAELDVRASNLATLHGMLGLPLPEGDPYGGMGVPRGVAKAWIAATIGKGAAVSRWAADAIREAAKDGTDLKAHRPAAVRDAVLARYPFFSGLPALLGCSAEPRLTGLRLQRIEADALTAAMVQLRDVRGVMALPMHDALIVQASAVLAAVEAMRGAWEAKVGTVPVLKVSWHDGRAEDVPPGVPYGAS